MQQRVLLLLQHQQGQKLVIADVAVGTAAYALGDEDIIATAHIHAVNGLGHSWAYYDTRDGAFCSIGMAARPHLQAHY